MQKGAKIAIFCGGIVVLLAVICVSIASYLRSAAGSRFLLAQLKTRLAESAGIELAYQSAAIDPFSTIHFENLTLTRHSADHQLEVRVPLVDIRYSLSLLARRITVETARIERPSVFVRSTASAAATPSEATADSTNHSGGLESLRAFVLSPAVRVSIKQFTLDGLRLDFESKTPSSSMKAVIPDLAVHFSLRLVPRDVAFSGDLHLSEASRLAYAAMTDGKSLELEASPAASARWTASLHQEGNQWIYEIQPSDLHLGSSALSFSQAANTSRARIQLASLQLDSQFRLMARTKKLLQLDPNSFDTVQIRNHLQTGAASGETQSARQVTPIRFDSQDIALDAELAKELTLALTSSTKNLDDRAWLARPAQATVHATAHITRDFTSLETEGTAALNDLDLLRFRGRGQSGSDLKFHIETNTAPDRRLLALLKAGSALERLGHVQATAQIDGAMKGRANSLLDANSKWTSDPVESDLKVSLVQDRAAAGKKATAVFAPIALQAHVDKDGDKYGFRASADGKSLQLGTKHLRDFALQADGTVEKDRIDLDGQLKIENEQALRVQGSTLLQQNRLQLHSLLEAALGDSLEGLIGRNSLRAYGRWKAKTQLDATVQLPSTPKGTFLRDGGIQAKGSTVLTQVAPPDRKLSQLVAPEPIVIHHDADLEKGKGNVTLAAEAPSLEWRKIGRVAGTHFTTTVSSPDFATARDIDLAVELKQGTVTLAKEFSTHAPPLAGLNLAARASVRGGERFAMENLSAEFNHAMVSLAADASGKMQAKDFQIKGKLSAEIPKDFPPVAGHKMRGRVDFPWTLSVLHGDALEFDGDIDLVNLSWSKGVQRITGISGRIPVSEKLVRDGRRVRFAHLITENPFERVDYERLRPLLHGADQVRIEQIGVEEKTYGPLVGYFSVAQNMVFAHQFDANIGSAGLAYGEMYFDMYPANLQLGFLARLTSLNLVEILPRRYLARVPKGDKNVSARSGLVVNLNKGTINGRIDITEIGASQLITLINVLDPKYEDGKMNLVRDALGVGYPTFVQMAFQRGYLDMGVDLSVLGVSQRFDVRGVPLSRLVSSATTGIVKKTQEGPLK